VSMLAQTELRDSSDRAWFAWLLERRGGDTFWRCPRATRGCARMCSPSDP